MERIFIVTCLCLGIAVLTTCKEYRSDYEYNEQTDAFYKLHIETLRVGGAQQTCGVEGAKLLQLASAEDAIQVHRMMKNFPDIGDYVWVNDDGQEHESAEEPAIINFEPEESEYTPLDSVMRCEVVTRQGKEESAACYQELPFVCKVSARDAPYNRECNVYGKDYQRAQNVSSCYKIHPMPFTWNQAYAECSAEGAHLVVLNSQAEHDYVHNLMQTSKPVAGSYASWFFLAGFRAEPTTNITTRVFKTIFNETLQEAGFSTWAPNEPNNSKDNENCGTLFRNDGNLNDVDCTLQYGFICEKEVP